MEMKKDTEHLFWDRVDVLRDGMSLKSLSNKADVLYETIMSSRKNKKPLNLENTKRIAYVLDASIEFLFTGDSPDMRDDDYSDLRPSGRATVLKPSFYKRLSKPKESKDSGYIELPIYPQSVSAGGGQEWLEDTAPSGRLPVPLDVLGDLDPRNVGVMRASGDSMTGAGIHNEDYVIWSSGLIRGDGIYVLAVHGELLVKRLEFDQFDQKIKIISENKNYREKVIDADSDIMRICGKVIGWMHRHPY